MSPKICNCQTCQHKALHLQIKEQIASFAAEVLKPRFNTHEVSREDYKWVLRKTVDKASLFMVLALSCLLMLILCYSVWSCTIHV